MGEKFYGACNRPRRAPLRLRGFPVLALHPGHRPNRIIANQEWI